MSRLLFSWIAYNHDFIFMENGIPVFNPEGTHGDCYTHGIFKYHEHILLTKASKMGEDNRFERVVLGIKPYANKIIPCYLNIDDRDVVNVEVLVKTLEKEIIKYPKDELEAYISPGTPAMQTAWYLLASKFNNLKLFQVDPPKFRNEKPPEKKWIKIIKTEVPTKLNYFHESIRKVKENTEGTLVTNSMKPSYERATKIALTHDITALILGETGTGKEFLARFIHQQSGGRSIKEMITINCAQLDDQLLESRLFGTVVGAYTDAKDTLGAFREANHSSLFLDEIGDISPRLQQTLLRVLETREVSPVGSFKEKHKVNVRVIAATHKNLYGLVEKGKFRRDLYHRICIADLETIPYRMLPRNEKNELFEFIDEKVRKKYGIKQTNKLSFSKQAKDCIENYMFPGNLRELNHLIERLYVFNEIEIKFEDLPFRIRFPDGTGASLKLKDVKERHILKVYKMCGENISKAEKILGQGASHNIIRNLVKKSNEKNN
ncbi:sigma 54-interacting transcriptional regulator [Polaribacter sp.]|uniref:sigma 54-interacting transcriptional regulator n=1 Tax=Polaribacter sp. TaxID=1920175 RepID=UPI003F6BE0DE